VFVPVCLEQEFQGTAVQGDWSGLGSVTDANSLVLKTVRD
jgi:hypothetical protein